MVLPLFMIYDQAVLRDSSLKIPLDGCFSSHGCSREEFLFLCQWTLYSQSRPLRTLGIRLKGHNNGGMAADIHKQQALKDIRIETWHKKEGMAASHSSRDSLEATGVTEMQ